MPEILKPRKAPSNFLGLVPQGNQAAGFTGRTFGSLRPPQHPPSAGGSCSTPALGPAESPGSGGRAAPRCGDCPSSLQGSFREGPSIFQQKTCQCREPVRGASHGAALPAPEELPSSERHGTSACTSSPLAVLLPGEAATADEPSPHLMVAASSERA